MSALLGVALGTVFILAGASKARAPGDELVLWLAQLGVPPRLADGVGRNAVLAELVLGATLLAGVGGPWPVVVATVVTLGFVGLHLRAHALGVTGDCGCVGASGSAPDPPLALVRALLMASLAVAALSAHVLDGPTGFPHPLGATASGVCVGVAVFLSLALVGAVRDFNNWRYVISSHPVGPGPGSPQ
jgi:uncharacterized membrane protein YphA (DoxX/SURF4 family)